MPWANEGSVFFTYFAFPKKQNKHPKMKLKTLALLSLTLLVLGSCKKKSAPTQKEYFFTYKVKISRKITEPTIISGFYGKVMKYEGDFQPAIDPETRQAAPAREPEPSRTQILIYTADQKEKFEAASYTDDGITFYNLKKLKKAGAKPKYIVTPNKSGFYQLDLGTGEYLALLRVKKNRGYFNGGVRTLNATTGNLQELEMRVDYNATF